MGRNVEHGCVYARPRCGLADAGAAPDGVLDPHRHSEIRWHGSMGGVIRSSPRSRAAPFLVAASTLTRCPSTPPHLPLRLSSSYYGSDSLRATRRGHRRAANVGHCGDQIESLRSERLRPSECRGLHPGARERRPTFVWANSRSKPGALACELRPASCSDAIEDVPV